VLTVGPPGVRKTMLALALGLKAVDPRSAAGVVWPHDALRPWSSP
jgi:hypothetical protein